MCTVLGNVEGKMGEKHDFTKVNSFVAFVLIDTIEAIIVA